MSLGRSTDLSVDIDGDATGYERAVASAERATLSAQRAVMSYDRSVRTLGLDLARLEKQLDDDITAALDRQHDAMTKTGRGMLLFGGMLAAGLALAGREAMQWESAWTGVKKTVDGTPEELAALEEQLRNLTHILPATHEEIAAVAEAAGQLGVAVPDIAAFTKTMVDLATTTDLDADTAATQIAKLMNVMRSAPDDVDNLGAALVALGNNGASTESAILSLAQRLSGAGQLVGASESDVLALASAMSDLGIEAELGGGAASRAITKMYAAVVEGGDALDRFAAAAGMSADQFAAAFQNDPIRALDAFVKGLGRIDGAGGNVIQVLEDVGLRGTQNAQVLLRLSGAGDRLTDSLDLSSEAWEENLALITEADQRYQTAESRARIAMNTIVDGAIDIGAVVLPVFVDMIEFIANIATAFGDLPGPVKTVLTVLALLTAAFAVAGGAALVAIPKIAAFKAAVTALEAGALKTAGTRLMGMAGFLAGPWGVALAGATVAIGLFAAAQGAAKRRASELMQTLDEQTGAFTENTRQATVNSLIQSGAAEDAAKLGISVATLTDAILGNADAQKAVSDAITTTRTQVGDSVNAYESAAASVYGWVGVMDDSEVASIKVIRALEDEQNALSQSVRQWELNADGMKKSNTVAQGAAGAQEALAGQAGETADAFSELTEEADELTEQVDALKDSFDALSGGFLSEREASRAVRDQLREVRKAMREYREEHGDLRGAFKKGTKSGDEFAGMLDDLAVKLQEQVAATLERTGSEKAAQRVLRESKKTLYEVALQMLGNEKAAWAYVDAVLGIPKIAQTDFRSNADEATRKAEAYQRVLDRLNGQRVTTWIANKIDSPDGPGVTNPDADTSRPKPSSGGSTPDGAERTVRDGVQRTLSGPIVGPDAGTTLQGTSYATSSSGPATAVLDGPLHITGEVTIDKNGRMYLTGIADDSALRTVQGARHGNDVRERMNY